MPDINLLGAENRRQPASLLNIMPLLVKLLTLVLILLAVYYAFTRFRISSANKQVQKLQQEVSQKRSELVADEQRNQVLTRQAQLVDLQQILSQHLFWSRFLNSELPRITLKSASYSSISAQSDGTVILVVSVPTYEDLDKYLQVFDLPKVNKDLKQFTDVQVKSITRAQQGNSLLTSFKIELKYNTADISYAALRKAATEQSALPAINEGQN